MRVDLARGVAAAAAAAGVLVVVVVARSSPTHPFVDHSGSGPSAPAPTLTFPTLSGSINTGSAGPDAQFTHGSGLHAAILVVAVLIVVGTLAVAFRFRPRLSRGTRSSMRGGIGQVDDAVRPAPEDVTAGIDSGFDALERGPAAEAIIACWLRVEAAAEAAGAVVRPTETSAEFVDRVLGAYGVHERPMHALAALYREARFSSHAITEADRGAARSYLDAIRRDLAGARAAG